MSAVIRPTGPINAPLPGLLDFFSLKTLGQNPTDVTQVIQLTEEILSFVLAGKREILSMALAPTTSGNINISLSSIPLNEAWFLEAVTYNISLAGAVLAGQWTLAVSLPGFPGIYLTQPQAGTTANNCNGGIILPQQMLFTSGYQFNVLQQSSSGAAFTVAPTGSVNLSMVRVRM